MVGTIWCLRKGQNVLGQAIFFRNEYRRAAGQQGSRAAGQRQAYGEKERRKGAINTPDLKRLTSAAIFEGEIFGRDRSKKRGIAGKRRIEIKLNNMGTMYTLPLV